MIRIPERCPTCGHNERDYWRLAKACGCTEAACPCAVRAFHRRLASANRKAATRLRASLLQPKSSDVGSEHARFTLFAHADPVEAERAQKRLEAMGAEVIRETR